LLLNNLVLIFLKNFFNFKNYLIKLNIKTGDYKKYLDVQNEINFNIKEAFDK